MTGASLGFGKTLVCASYNIFLMSVLTSMCDPRVPTLAAVEEEKKTLCNEKELNGMREVTKRKRRTYLSSHESGSVQPRCNSNLTGLNLV